MAGDAAGNKATGANISCEGIYGLYLDNKMSLEEFGQMQVKYMEDFIGSF